METTMNLNISLPIKLFILLTIIFSLAACSAAGNTQFTSLSPAGFWYGLWHGVISIISMVIHLFNDSVKVYEINNSGGWYDFGFLLGVIGIWGGGSHFSCKTAADKKHDKEWDEIGHKVEIKVMHKLKDWAENDEENDSTQNKEDWDEISKKVEKKLKRKIREWAEKD